MQKDPSSSLVLPLVSSWLWHTRAGSALVFSITGVIKGDVEVYKKCFLVTSIKKKKKVCSFSLFFHSDFTLSWSASAQGEELLLWG